MPRAIDHPTATVLLPTTRPRGPERSARFGGQIFVGNVFRFSSDRAPCIVYLHVKARAKKMKKKKMFKKRKRRARRVYSASRTAILFPAINPRRLLVHFRLPVFFQPY